MKKTTYLLLGASLLTVTGCSVFGTRSQYDEATHTRLTKDGDMEIREYEPMVVVQTAITAGHTDAGNQAFRKLFSYISGNNISQDKIAMTTPVFSQANTAASAEGEKIAMTVPVISASTDSETTWNYQFVLPAQYTLETAPLPKDPTVEVTEVPAGRAAVIRYSGRWEDGLRERKTAELRAWMAQQGHEAVSAPRYAAYDPPWTLPALRRNEVLIEIK